MESSTPTSQVPRHIAFAAGAGTCIAGILVLAGWAFGIAFLMSIRAGWPKTAPATALGFVLAGSALLLLAVDPDRFPPLRARLRLARGLAVLTLVLGLVKLLHYVFGLNLPFDRLGFTALASVAPATACDFLLIGSALWAAASRRHFAMFQSLVLAAALIATLGTVGYLYSGEFLRPFAEMALPTSLLFLTLSFGVLCLRDDRGLMSLIVSPTAGGWMTRRMLLLIPPVIVVIEWLEARAETAGWFGTGNPRPLFVLLDVIVLGSLVWIAGSWLHRIDTRRAREETLRQQHQAQLSLFVEHAPAAIAMLDREMRYIAVSRRWLSDYRLGTQDLVGRSHYDVFPEAPPRWKEIHRRCLAGSVEESEEDSFPRADGSIDWLHWAIHPWHQANGAVGGLLLFSEVITERVHSAEKIQRLNRVYAVLSQINSLIVRVRERQVLFDESCRIAVEHGTFGLAWIGLFHAASNEIVPVASAGLADSEPPLTRIDVSEGSEQLKSIPALALRERRAVFDNNIAEGLGKENERYRQILEKGFCSVIALPLIVDDFVTGVISMWSMDADFFDDDELKLLNELAGDISFALQFLTKQEELDYISYFDVLTGLSNRTLFLDRLNQQLQSRYPKSKVVTLLVLDLEHFSTVNDTLGRYGADDLLRVVARRLEQACEGRGNLARIGADMFAFVLSDARDPADIAHKTEAILTSCFKEPIAVTGTELRIAARIGVARSPADGLDAETLLRNAEAALKEAKSSHNRYLFYSADMNAQAAQAMALETQLREAAERGEFILYYQPKVELANGRLSGLEALMRWRNPDKGLVPPARFIPILEETGLIVDVGKWAVQTALSHYDAWTANDHRVPRIAINVSAVQLREKDFAAGIVNLIESSGVAPDALELEITESLVMRDIDRNARAFSILRGMGVHIAIDDFGTGYSSLSYLARLPVDKIKIDRSFVKTMMDSTQDRSVVSTIITLAHSVGLPVVAEGVETAEQAEALAELGCDQAQGYYFYKPMPPAEAADLMSRSTDRIAMVGLRC